MAFRFLLQDNWASTYECLGSRKRFWGEGCSDLDMLNVGSLQFLQIQMSRKWLGDEAQASRSVDLRVTREQMVIKTRNID